MLENAIDFSALLFALKNASNKSEDDTTAIYEDEKNIYLIITSANLELSAAQIIRYYEMRPKIEEYFR